MRADPVCTKHRAPMMAHRRDRSKNDKAYRCERCVAEAREKLAELRKLPGHHELYDAVSHA